MRILALMRGIPASGKSTWIKNMGLSEYTLSADSHTLDSYITSGINQQNDKQV